jgi:hypothetical protein
LTETQPQADAEENPEHRATGPRRQRDFATGQGGA